MHQFPFGAPLLTVEQLPPPKAEVFVLGVYASAVHARWVNPDGTTRVRALTVASEPSIFWSGNDEAEIIKSISIPPEAGHLEVPGGRMNGPSGHALDRYYLEPLGYTRETAWLCDLLPQSRLNAGQAEAIQSRYAPVAQRLNLPAASIPPVPKRFASRQRTEEIAEEFLRSRAHTLITLGDVPLKEFVRELGLALQPSIANFGTASNQYGRRHSFRLEGRQFELLPLVHPRQAARLGLHNPALAQAHDAWVKRTLPTRL
jgi:uracil-DNA glycosylase